MLNYDNWQILKTALGAHRRECRVCRQTERGCAPYQREFHWGKLNYLRWIEHWVESCHPEVERRRRELEKALSEANKALAELEEQKIWDRTALALREELQEGVDRAFQDLVEHYRT